MQVLGSRRGGRRGSYQAMREVAVSEECEDGEVVLLLQLCQVGCEEIST